MAAVGFEPTKHLQHILSVPPLTGLGYAAVLDEGLEPPTNC